MTETPDRAVGYQYRAREARDNFRELLDAVEGGAVAMVVRDAAHPVVLVRREDYDSVLQEAAPFNVLASVRPNQVTLWLDDVPVVGAGPTLGEAEDAFVDALIDYADLWVRELHHAPNHRQNADLVRRVTMYMAQPDRLREVVFNGQQG